MNTPAKVLPRLLATLCLLLGILPTRLLAQAAPVNSPHNPHVPSGPGPWFEGWYVRVTDTAGSRSVAVICASHLPKGQAYDPNARLPGYLNVLVSEGDGAPTLSYAAFPQSTFRTVKGQPVSASADFSAPADFEWSADGFGTVTEDSADIRIPGVVEVKIHTGNRIPWSPDSPEEGPEGFLLKLPFPLHWHVHSLGSDADYEVTILDGSGLPHVEGRGYAHWEKNWQDEFPLGWVWSQGIGENNESQFVVSIADVALGPNFQFSPWIMGYRSPRLSWDMRFTMPGSTVRTAIRGCDGLFVMIAADRYRSMRVIAYAPPETYGSVAVPTENGFVADRGGESFSASVLVTAYLRIPGRGGRTINIPIDKHLFKNAALEFGNDHACK